MNGDFAEFRRFEVTKRSILTGKENTLAFHAKPEDYGRWKNGTLIQDAMPYLKDNEREFLISGMSFEEQERFFDDD